MHAMGRRRGKRPNARSPIHLVEVLLAAALGVTCAAGEEGVPNNLETARRSMIEAIEADARETGWSTGRPTLSASVLEAMVQVPRHEFVPVSWRREAYQNHPLPIGEGQTISQPFIVALMTDLLDPEPSDHVLEIGTGSGYQAAVLAELVERVHTIEIVPELGRSARERLRRLGYSNVEVRVGDGWVGWPEAAPFDGILITAAIGEVPPPLLDQLAPGGRLVLPLGETGGRQELAVVTRGRDGDIDREEVLPVRFVPFTGSRGRGEDDP